MRLKTPIPTRLFFIVAAAGVSTWAAGCGDSVVTNECGTYDPDDDMHGTGPTDPTEEALVEACDDLCIQKATVEGCKTEVTACRDDCRLEACNFCPGTLAPLTRCLADNFDATGCTCADGTVTCSPPAACEKDWGTHSCGG